MPVEGYFAELSRRRLKRGVFKSVANLVWTKNPNKITAAVKREFHVLDSIQ
jgi:hypothetical protein